TSGASALTGFTSARATAASRPSRFSKSLSEPGVECEPCEASRSFCGRARRGPTIVRVAAAAMMVIHGTYRAIQGGVAPFGEFLGSRGLPAGTAVAWLMTVMEIAGGLLLVAGRFVRPLCAWFIL